MLDSFLCQGTREIEVRKEELFLMYNIHTQAPLYS